MRWWSWRNRDEHSMNKFWLLSADWHLTDVEIEQYRWKIFDTIIDLSTKYNLEIICIAGDLVDRKDRHSGRLVNNLVSRFSQLSSKTKAEIIIIMGNHDAPLKGTPYWAFLSQVGIRYVTEPLLYKDVWFLPFSSNPIRDWQNLDLISPKAIIMHQPVEGVSIGNNRKLGKAPKLPKLNNCSFS